MSITTQDLPCRYRDNTQDQVHSAHLCLDDHNIYIYYVVSVDAVTIKALIRQRISVWSLESSFSVNIGAIKVLICLHFCV